MFARSKISTEVHQDLRVSAAVVVRGEGRAQGLSRRRPEAQTWEQPNKFTSNST